MFGTGTLIFIVCFIGFIVWLLFIYKKNDEKMKERIAKEKKEAFDREQKEKLEKERAFLKIISRFENKEKARKLKMSLTYAGTLWGVPDFDNEKENPFFVFVEEFLRRNVPINDNTDRFLSNYISQVNSGTLMLSKAFGPESDFLYEKSLYERSQDDFSVTIRAFEIVKNPELQKKFFMDTSVANKEALYEEDGKIKPANMIRLIVDIWESQGRENYQASLDNSDASGDLEDEYDCFEIDEAENL